jgi:hypothetical protein
MNNWSRRGRRSKGARKECYEVVKEMRGNIFRSDGKLAGPNASVYPPSEAV